jgi:hypothetical protein
MAQVRLNFDDGVNEYTFPLLQEISDPKEGMKSVVIHGNRADGAIVIPGGKRSIEIRVRGILLDNDGYEDITTLMAEMRSKVTTDLATLTLEHFNGSTWEIDWSYTVRRIDEITFPQSFRISDQEYEVSFLVVAF